MSRVYLAVHKTWLVTMTSRILLWKSALALQNEDACWLASLQCSGSGFATLHCKADQGFTPQVCNEFDRLTLKSSSQFPFFSNFFSRDQVC